MTAPLLDRPPVSGPATADRWTHTSPDGRRFAIRHARSLYDLDRCLALQQETWGYPDLEVVPRNMYVLAQALGGHVLCAWDEQASLAGFAMAIAAHQPTSPQRSHWMTPVGDRSAPTDPQPEAPTPYLHSHQVAVAPAFQRCGLGFALKLAQREAALAAGIEIMRWTFDPLMARNAAFNLAKLGATVQRYIPDFYGRLGSALQGGTPTDRFLAEWRLRSVRVEAAVAGTLTAPTQPTIQIALSPHIGSWKAQRALPEIEAAQQSLRRQFLAAFAEGLRLEGFSSHPDGGGAYLLVQSGSTATAPQPRDAKQSHVAAARAR